MNRLITLTEERLNKAKTPKGGYCKAQLQVLGIQWPAKKGWRRELIGKKITLRRFIAFVAASKNKLYLEEIEGLLPTLNPPVTELIQKPLSDLPEKQSSRKTQLSKKELKRERTAAKRAERNVQREHKIREYGIHNATRLITEKAKSSIHFLDMKFINSLLNEDEPFIESNDVLRLYALMKKHGVILSYRKGGSISASGYSKISRIWREQLLYVIRDKENDHCKIGVSKDPKGRRRELQTSNANKLLISMVFETKKNAIRLEKSLHKHFRKQRKSGEWFAGVSDNEIIKAIGERATITDDY